MDDSTIPKEVGLKLMEALDEVLDGVSAEDLQRFTGIPLARCKKIKALLNDKSLQKLVGYSI